MMERHFDAELKKLKHRLLSMAGYVESAVDHAIRALESRDVSEIKQVDEAEGKINRAQLEVDEHCLKLLALQQPLATDLRLIVAIIKINTDLERMGDQAVNIAGNTARYLKAEPLKPLIDLPKMFAEVRQMVRESLEAFVKVDEPLARAVLKRDDKVDAFKNIIFKDVLDHIKQRPDLVEQGLNLILIARNLERIGDHATNIAEDVIFAITGEDVRHAATLETLRKALT